jgi:arylsulfatase A-like enzyme
MAPGWIRRLGEACLLGLGVALLSAVPTALRAARSGGSFPEGLLAGAAVLVPLVVLSLLLVRAAGRGFRAMVGQASLRVVVLGIALWIGIALPALAVLGAVLKAGTNHRGLGGTTFAIAGAVAVIVSALLAHRLVSYAQGLVERGVRPWIPAAVGAVVGVVPLVVVAAPLAGGSPPHDAAGAVRSAIVDGAIVVVATALVASLELGPSWLRAAGIVGVPAAVILSIAGFARVEYSPPLAAAMRAGGGLPVTLLHALESWSDHDGDGTGAHFGGQDCDEGDPGRRPGVAEVAGDGIDQDCDGIDPDRARASRIASAPVVLGAAAPVGMASAASAPAASAHAAASVAVAPTAAPDAATSKAAALALPADKPDIVLVTMDTVRADHTSVHGYAKDTTPALAALAKRGVVFEHAYATASDTQRALAPLVTGRRLSQSARDRREWPTLYSDNDTLAERLHRSGYATAAVTSFTWLSDERGFAQGFDRFEPAFLEVHPERGATGAVAAARAKVLIAELSKQPKPFFLWVHLFDAHERYMRHEGIDFGRGKTGAYDAEIAFVDRQLATLVAAVHASRRGDRTAWLVHGSHGEAFDEHGVSGHGAELYAETIHVPWVLVAPGIEPARRAAAVSTVDITPTVLALGGAPAEGVEGQSLLPIATGAEDRRRGPVYARAARRAALIDWPLKIIVVERKRTDRVLLFDLSADPREQRDLSRERPDDTARLTKLLAQHEAGAANEGRAVPDTTAVD